MGVMKALGMRNGVAREALEAKILEAARTTAKVSETELLC